MRSWSGIAVAMCGALVLVAPVRAQEKPSDTLLTVNHYLDWEQVGNPQLSPDGSQVVYTRSWVNKLEDRWESALWIVNADGSKNRFLTKGSNARWSPDGTRILYTADGEPKGTQIFVRWMDAEGATTQVTRLTESPGNVQWSPDGKTISFTMIVRDTARWRISLPPAPEGAKWTPAPRVVDRLHYRADRRGFLEDGFYHLFIVPADGGTPRQLTSGDWHVGASGELPGGGDYDWTPDGKTIVFDGLREPDADVRSRGEAYLYAVELATGAIRPLVTRKGRWSAPEVSPDGRTVAFVGRDYTDKTYQANELWVIGIDGSGMRQISGGLDRDPANLTWAPDGGGLYFTVPDRGTSNVYFAPTRGGGPRRVTDGVHLLSLSSLDRNLNAVGTRTDFDEPPDVVRYSLRRFQGTTRLTAVNDDVLANKRLGRVEELWYTSTGGTRIQGWVVKPPSFDPAKKYPLIMEIHGGPHAMYNVGFSYMYQNFAANGYVVLYTNPRGSTGYGTAFGAAISQAYPGVDYDDLMAGVDTVVARGYVDPERLYVGGCSGGGVLSSWVVGHTDRFAAAAVRCPVINWISMAGQTDIPLFTFNWFEKPFWEDPEPWLKQSSLMYVDNVTTPTLIMTGELDLRTPMPQSEEYYTALKLRGVETVLLRFHGEYHGTGSKPSNFMRTQLYMLSWYGKHRRGAEAAAGSQ
ncbi:MAG TPA: S9 family peptidase [Gemmatimonadales bacterium]|nr:S9 family peptidase [Gemmatimonadales bacterium]